ncbi:hypothetical protein ASE01_03345 [Nocardioides sp. Root190]|uniref:pentapeptide repeat-containing protein n=1 Tax=Nocardioides sp. Root190 TaxID=1736488 RepID=UPI0006F73501|nr:pentapeptide repeat-containing protein [Nocardioides sp. Root190]KRB78326.1 hypothetical protein ASE01_03345 [Nocardioides sp. Root190]
MPEPRHHRVHAPKIDPIRHGQLEVGQPDQLVPNADLHAAVFTDVATSTLAMRAATLDMCRLEGISTRETDWNATRLRETTVTRMDSPVMKAARTEWRDLHVRDSRLGSVEAYEARWSSVHFVDCKLGYINLRGAELLDVAFTGCIIEELDFVQTTARRVRFSETRLSRLTAQQGTFEHVDLRGADIAEIDGLDSLRGVVISPRQLHDLAPALAAERGIVVRER